MLGEVGVGKAEDLAEINDEGSAIVVRFGGRSKKMEAFVTSLANAFPDAFF